MIRPKSVGILVLTAIPLGTLTALEAQRTPTSAYIPLPPPVLIIGTEGDPDYEFVSIIAALRLPNGEIAVADWQTPTIRVYSERGQLSRKLGRKGEGPGEFEIIGGLLAAHDTLIAFDFSLLRVTRYLASGPLLGTQPVRTTPEDGRVHIAGRLANGRWLVTTPHAPNWNHGPGVYRDTLRVGTVAPSATGSVHWVGNFPGASFFAYMPGQDKAQWSVGWLFFAPTTLVTSVADTIVVGDTGMPELQYFRYDGRLLRRLPLPLGPPPDLSRHRTAARDEDLAQARPYTNTAYLQAMYDVPRPPPRYRDFLVAPGGQVWTRLFEERPSAPTSYLILDATGTIRARVSLPPRSHVLAVQPPWVLVALRDANDVERVGMVRWAVR
ncbi:MAG: 6-bladed beta-propeller [Acidobacteriota bacterium]